MKNSIKFLILVVVLVSCKTQEINTPIKQTELIETTSDFTIAFGSGNNQKKDNLFWQDILDHKANVWIWGGDNIYCDTEDMKELEKCYQKQKNKTDYQHFTKNIEVIGMWDDHDYGVNDGGAEYPFKKQSQELFLNFLNVSKSDVRRSQNGTYSSKIYTIKKHKVKVIILDTRYFRTQLTKDNETRKRYKPNTYGEGTMLGETQWEWLEKELQDNDADYTIINSSIQFLSSLHGFESWGTMPHEMDRMQKLILTSQAKNIFILSGDRHISEITMKKIGMQAYPLYDFTSSGLTHAYTSFNGEENPYRVSRVIHQKSYGLVKFNFEKNQVTFEMWGEHKRLLASHLIQFYN
jgi:alkaline phosphatase D